MSNVQDMTNFTIQECLDTDQTRWDDYLLSTPDANFYQCYAWRKINTDCFGHQTFYLTAQQNDKITGVLPLIFIDSRLFGRILSSMPFVNFGGISSEQPAAIEKLLERASELTKELDVDYCELRSLRPVSSKLPCNSHKVSMSIELNDDPEVLWNAYKSKHRTNIRRVKKEGVTVISGREELLDDFYHVMANSWRSLGTPIYQKRYFQSILKAFPTETKIFILYLNEKPVATAFNGYYKGVVEGMWAGALPEYRRLQPNYVLYWEMIKDACLSGFKHYHLGRSTAGSGAEDFKKKWNATAIPLYWEYILNNKSEIPQLNTNNPKYRIAIDMWKKLPLPATTTIGPYLAKSIP